MNAVSSDQIVRGKLDTGRHSLPLAKLRLVQFRSSRPRRLGHNSGRPCLHHSHSIRLKSEYCREGVGGAWQSSAVSKRKSPAAFAAGEPRTSYSAAGCKLCRKSTARLASDAAVNTARLSSF